MCIFCKIISKEIPADVVMENNEMLAFKDIHPVAPVHVLIVPKKHIDTINDLKDEDAELMGKLILAARDIAKDKGISNDGYKLLFRVGKHGGQEVEHIHLHLIGGAKLFKEIRPL